MSHATGHNLFTNQYLLNTHLAQILQIMYNKSEKKMIFFIQITAMSLKHIEQLMATQQAHNVS